MTDFNSKLIRESKGTPYYESLSHIIFIGNILKSNSDLSPDDFNFNYTVYSDKEILEMGLLEMVQTKQELIFAISQVKTYFARTLGTIASAEKGIIGGNNVFDEYIDLFADGFDAWADVLSFSEAFVKKL